MDLNKLLKILLAVIMFLFILSWIIRMFVGVTSYYSTQDEVNRIMQLDSLHE